MESVLVRAAAQGERMRGSCALGHSPPDTMFLSFVSPPRFLHI